jgi:hypothetical protein
MSLAGVYQAPTPNSPVCLAALRARPPGRPGRPFARPSPLTAPLPIHCGCSALVMIFGQRWLNASRIIALSSVTTTSDPVNLRGNMIRMRSIIAAVLSTAAMVTSAADNHSGVHSYQAGWGEPGTTWVYLHYDSQHRKYVIDLISQSINLDIMDKAPPGTEIITVSPDYLHIRPYLSGGVGQLSFGPDEVFPDNPDTYYYGPDKPYVCSSSDIPPEKNYHPCRSRFIKPTNRYTREQLTTQAGNQIPSHFVRELDMAELSRALRDTDLVSRVHSSRQSSKPKRSRP